MSCGASEVVHAMLCGLLPEETTTVEIPFGFAVIQRTLFLILCPALQAAREGGGMRYAASSKWGVSTTTHARICSGLQD